MYDLSQVMSGLERYINSEFLTKMPALQQFVGGMAIGRIRGNAVNVFNTLKENPMFKMLDVIDEDNKVNVDELVRLANEQMDKGALTVDLPVFGITTFNKEDVSKLATMIKG